MQASAWGEACKAKWLETPCSAPNQEPGTHAYFGSLAAITEQELTTLGKMAAKHLELVPEDKVCIAITLCHSFGIGSGVCSALHAGATVVLPAVGGIRGCGVPSERAQATATVLKGEHCTVLFADTHVVQSLPPDLAGLSLRTGVVKVGSGTDFLEATVNYAGVPLSTMGKRK